MTQQHIPTEAQVLDWMTSLSNWRRWGGDDQLGCLNLIAPAKRRQAAALVRDGEIVSCARPITTETAPDIRYQVQRFMVDSGEGRDTDPPERKIARRGAAEFIGMVFHGQSITHIDALSHYSWEAECTTTFPQARLHRTKARKATPLSRRPTASLHAVVFSFFGCIRVVIDMIVSKLLSNMCSQN